MNVQRLFDHLSIWASGACLLHCLITPVLLVFMPIVASTTLPDEEFHLLLLALVLPSSSLALFLGCRGHRDRAVLTLGTLGLGLLAVAALIGHTLWGEGAEKVATVLGGGALIAGHYRNHRLCSEKRCSGHAG